MLTIEHNIAPNTQINRLPDNITQQNFPLTQVISFAASYISDFSITGEYTVAVFKIKPKYLTQIPIN